MKKEELGKPVWRKPSKETGQIGQWKQRTLENTLIKAEQGGRYGLSRLRGDEDAQAGATGSCGPE